MLRWLEPEEGENKILVQGNEIAETIKKRFSSNELRRKITVIAQSQTAGIWRIKRAKIILGCLDGRSLDQMVIDVRVQPVSILECQKEFVSLGMAYFDTPKRLPTQREARVEKILLFLNDPPHSSSKEWDDLTVRYIGHDFTARQILLIRQHIIQNPELTRNGIANHCCKQFSLYQSNGNPALNQTKDILKRMDMDNIVTLPQIKKNYGRRTHCKEIPPSFPEPDAPHNLKCSDLKNLQFIPVHSKQDSTLWRELIHRFHYIKTVNLFGAQLRYLVYGGTGVVNTLDHLRSLGTTNHHWADPYKGFKRGKHLLGALGFASSSWRLADRELYIGWTEEQREANLKLVVNNVRFLILPWIRSENLASRLLGGICRQLPMDWQARYGYRPALLETFVQLDRFKGTCYKAANWRLIGTTGGYSLVHSYKNLAKTKAIFVYPLCRNFQQQLTHLPLQSSRPT